MRKTFWEGQGQGGMLKTKKQNKQTKKDSRILGYDIQTSLARNYKLACLTEIWYLVPEKGIRKGWGTW